MMEAQTIASEAALALIIPDRFTRLPVARRDFFCDPPKPALCLTGRCGGGAAGSARPQWEPAMILAAEERLALLMDAAKIDAAPLPDSGRSIGWRPSRAS